MKKALVVGAASASAHGGPGHGPGGASISSLMTQAAKELGVARAKLVSAIQDSAATHVSNAAADGDVTAAQADDLTQEAQDNLSVAYALSETKTVASNLGLTTAALNTGFRAARKAILTARIDQALADGAITSDEATASKAKLNAATLPGYKGGLGPFGPGGGFGH